MADTLISQTGECPIDIVQGAPFVMEVTCLGPNPENPNDLTDLVPVSLAGYAGRAQMRETLDGGVQLQFAIEVAQETAGDRKGKAWVRASAAATAAVRRDGVWDLELYGLNDATDVVPIFTVSPATLKREVTRA